MDGLISDWIGPITEKIWMGASDRAREGVYVWEATGQQLTYSDWRVSQPNNQNGGQDCLSYYFLRGWDDDECSRSVNWGMCEHNYWQ